MRKTLLYLVILLILGAGVYYFIFSSKSSFGTGETSFNIQDTGAIGKIFIANTSGESVLLRRTDSGWTVNDKYLALSGNVHTLLLTLYKQAAVAPVPQNAHNNIVKSMAGNGIKVEIADRSNRTMTIFYVGTETSDLKGTYMITKGAATAYVVKMEGFTGFLTPRYSPYLKDWRARLMIDLLPAQVKSVNVTYPAFPVNSFTLTQDNGRVAVNADSSIIRSNQFNERRAKLYLTFFKYINCEGYVNGAEGLDSIIKAMPEKCIVDVRGNNGFRRQVAVYYLPLNRRSKNRLTSDRFVADDFDPDRFYAIMDKDTMLIQQHVFEKMFRNAYEFYQPDNAEDAKQKHPLTTSAPLYPKAGH
ncbi:MAG: hypothetical protein H0X33_03775 [Taibaiella sp.]|nr:hypothetical protein [Taibaiella sp.]